MKVFVIYGYSYQAGVIALYREHAFTVFVVFVVHLRFYLWKT